MRLSLVPLESGRVRLLVYVSGRHLGLFSFRLSMLSRSGLASSKMAGPIPLRAA